MVPEQTNYKVIAAGGVYVRESPVQSDANIVRVAEYGEVLQVIGHEEGWVRTAEGYVMDRSYIIEPISDDEEVVDKKKEKVKEEEPNTVDEAAETSEVSDEEKPESEE